MERSEAWAAWTAAVRRKENRGARIDEAIQCEKANLSLFEHRGMDLTLFNT
jgi:hypothetical protein